MEQTTFTEYLKAHPTAAGLAGRHLLRVNDLSTEEIVTLLDFAVRMKTGVISREEQLKVLPGCTLAEIFEKPSLRTRVSFETGIYQLGGQGIYITSKEIQIGVRESVYDISNVLTRIVDIAMARVFKHSTVADLAKYAKKPVINGLCDTEHPCQALADILTLVEERGDVKGLRFAYVGDGNNVCQSLMIICAKLGIGFVCACPKGYYPAEDYVALAASLADENGTYFELTESPAAAAAGADVIYTDTWTSMGQEEEAKQRAEAFAGYRVDSALMAKAGPKCIFMHCLPAHRGCEVTDEVMDSPQSRIFQEAENRLHAQKAVMGLLGQKV
ncbi:MAG: ornithine carbamoyltransferase [Abditibacteriota bacterium]|nr:ornithine carbamoyltransferase [Abditibacteriota bacterium]